MPKRGFTWNDEYRKNYFASPKVQQHLREFVELSSRPKSEEHKLKLSEAHKGKKFTEEHKEKLSAKHKFRAELKKRIEETDPTLSKDEVWSRVREMIRTYEEQNGLTEDN